ncbi:nucleoside-diphosphate-sugar epimerase family protein [Apiospora marii]|uniref:nucleoside-diphosphate-sugar epimerase family protein n=1 Tax=Apiospora marii TaxID=335849 RepID=UPI00313194D6
MVDTASKKVILVTGATGKQGSATIDALIAGGALDTHTLVAVTRNPESGSAKRLVGRGVQLVQGDLNDIPAIFTSVTKALGGGDNAKIWGVFSVQTAIGGGASPESEERQGKALVDAALANGLEHFVYTSADRGGEVRSFSNPTRVPHFISKHNIEHHLVEKAAAAAAAATTSSSSIAAPTPMTWTILRPVAFMDNFTPGFGTKIMATGMRVALQGKPIQLVGARDIGWFAAQAFLRPTAYAGRSVTLAGDEVTLADLRAVFQQKTGRDMPETFQFVAHIIFWLSAEFGSMFRWFHDEGFGADLSALRKEHPGLQSWGAWLESESDWVAKSK